MALAEKRDHKDWVSIYYTGGGWDMVNTFEVETFDLNDIKWCRADSALAVWDTPLENAILIYSAMTGEIVQRHQPSPYPGLGLKGVHFSPNHNYVMCALFDT